MLSKFKTSLIRCIIIAFVSVFCCSAIAQSATHFGPLFDSFDLTLDSGKRTEAFGLFYYNQQRDSETTLALPPLFSTERNPDIEQREDDFLYPLLTYEKYGTEYRWQLIQLFSFSGGKKQNDSNIKRFIVFPVYFQQRSPDTNENYTAVFPFYGHLKNRLFRDEIFFVMFPVYGETRKKDVVNENYFYPFFNLHYGNGMSGWQFWPFYGKEQKVITTSTNGFGDVESIAGFDHSFVLWPFYLSQDNNIGTDNPERFRASIPFYVSSHSPKRDATSVFWPFFTSIDDREKKYHEWQGPWPFVIFTRGEGKTTSRVWPFFSRSHNDEMESDSYIWPVYQFHSLHSDPLERSRTRVLFYLYDDTREKSTEAGKEKRRLDMWPFFTWHRDFDGNTRLQILAPIEPAIPDNRGVERNWSPLWSIWRAEENPKAGKSSKSLFWNFYRSDKTPDAKKISLFFGIFQYQSTGETNKLRLFFLPALTTHGKNN